MKEAREFVNDTGVDAWQLRSATSHGAYRTAPQLSFERLAEIRNAVSIPLVLHGGRAYLTKISVARWKWRIEDQYLY